MSSPKDTFQELLKKAGFSITRPRLAVFEALQEQEPLAMHELIKKVGDIDRASVYRTVELFERLGILERLHTGWKYKVELSDKFTAHHHHLTCVNCGTLVALNEHELEHFIEEIALAHNFKPSGHQIEIQGICEKCR